MKLITICLLLLLATQLCWGLLITNKMTNGYRIWAWVGYYRDADGDPSGDGYEIKPTGEQFSRDEVVEGYPLYVEIGPIETPDFSKKYANTFLVPPGARIDFYNDYIYINSSGFRRHIIPIPDKFRGGYLYDDYMKQTNPICHGYAGSSDNYDV